MEAGETLNAGKKILSILDYTISLPINEPDRGKIYSPLLFRPAVVCHNAAAAPNPCCLLPTTAEAGQAAIPHRTGRTGQTVLPGLPGNARRRGTCYKRRARVSENQQSGHGHPLSARKTGAPFDCPGKGLRAGRHSRSGRVRQSALLR